MASTSTLDPSTDDGAAAIERLRTERIAWLTTVEPDGQPFTAPIWFEWLDGEILLYSAKRARRNANLADNPHVAFNLNTDPTGDHFVILEGTARFEPDGIAAVDNPTYLAKYRSLIDEYGWTDASFSADYPHRVVITPTRWRAQ
jgi:PPOX class probable F420-dependent enzyme